MVAFISCCVNVRATLCIACLLMEFKVTSSNVGIEASGPFSGQSPASKEIKKE